MGFGELDMFWYKCMKKFGLSIVLAAALPPPVKKVGLMTEQIGGVVGVVPLLHIFLGFPRQRREKRESPY